MSFPVDDVPHHQMDEIVREAEELDDVEQVASLASRHYRMVVRRLRDIYLTNPNADFYRSEDSEEGKSWRK
ncbi:unnamed protein product [Caenorhabditis auriculariae]|uniref:Uncharacterized protein n=1 Tax=Caenorhabditis auriculariae TaxID=2777116 RepID=A0A8S1H5G0_9PELO|nr:unnamed protein product [Caenorhabditis auriculariae]